MKILLLTHYFPPEQGAPQRRWGATADRLASAGHCVDVVCPPPHYPTGRLASRYRPAHGTGRTEVRPSGVRVFRTSYLRHNGRILRRTLDHAWVAASSVRLVLALVRDGIVRPDIIVATAPALESLIAGHVLARRLAIPIVAEMRDAWPDLVAHTPGLLSPRGPVARAKAWVHEAVTRMQLKADAVVTTTEAFATVLRARGITPLRVIRNAADLARYGNLSSVGHHPHRPLRALYIGTVGRSQGLDIVVKAVAALRTEGTRVETRIIGQGADVPRLRKLNAHLGSPVEILDAVDASMVSGHYAWADTLIVSLRDWEPFSWTVPSKLYELLATGKHVTAIVAGESADIVRSTAAGVVVTPGSVKELVDLWRRLAADPRNLEISPEGRRWVRENANFDAMARDYVDLLQRVLSETGRPQTEKSG